MLHEQGGLERPFGLVGNLHRLARGGQSTNQGDIMSDIGRRSRAKVFLRARIHPTLNKRGEGGRQEVANFGDGAAAAFDDFCN